VAEVWLRSFAAALPGVRRAHSDDEVRRWVADVLLPSHDVWVAEDDGAVVGFVGWGDSRDASDEGELYAIYVLPEAWGSGAGPALMAAARAELEAAYATSILWVLEDNPRARRFYERAGWAPDGVRKAEERFGVRAPEVRYRKDFSSS